MLSQDQLVALKTKMENELLFPKEAGKTLHPFEDETALRQQLYDAFGQEIIEIVKTVAVSRFMNNIVTN